MTFAPDSMSLLLHVMSNSLLLASRLLDPNNIDSVFPRCNDKRFSTNYSLTDSNSLHKTSSISNTSLAYTRSLQLIAVSIFLIYIRNKRGPSIDPCGTPHVTDLNSKKHRQFLQFALYPLNMNVNNVQQPGLHPLLLI